MIYFTDLDRTIIYSSKFIDDSNRFVCIEEKEGVEISYMSNKSIKYLRDIMKFVKVIPSTTRSIEQFKRIDFAEYNINFPWAIVSNGGNILYKGMPLNEWNKVLKSQLKKCEALIKVREVFKRYENSNYITNIRDVDELFFYIVIDKEKFKKDFLEEFKLYLHSVNWDLYINGRKIYFIPKPVSKENAVEFLLKYLGEERFGALGDSIMDFNMLALSNLAYIPRGSELDKYLVNTNSYISREPGIEGTEEILQNILEANGI